MNLKKLMDNRIVKNDDCIIKNKRGYIIKTKRGEYIFIINDIKIDINKLYINLDKNKNIIIKSPVQLKNDNTNLKFICKSNKSNMYIYGNENTLNMFPSIVNNNIFSCIIITHVKDSDNNGYIILNTYKNTNKAKNPTGLVIKTETLRECVIRRLKSETGINSNEIKDIKEFGSFTSDIDVYDETWKNNCKIFYVKAKLTHNRLSEIHDYKSRYIKNIYIIPISTLVLFVTDLDELIPSVHYFLINTVLSKIYGFDFDDFKKSPNFEDVIPYIDLYW